MGEIIVNGNFQVLVSDPFAFMQHVCGLDVTGLLKKDEFYSNYWNQENVKKVNAMRSPLTFRSEHVVLNTVKNDLTEKWYKHCNSGIILNYFGHETINFAGSDFDYDIVATTSNKEIIDGVYKNEMPVIYDVPKTLEMNFSEKDLYEADLFSFGSIIGLITNKSSIAYTLLADLEKGSNEYLLTLSRLKQCCKAQSAQIDKAKIGKKVKGVPEVWTKFLKVLPSDNENTIKEKNFYNSILLNKYPYFFRYRYKKVNREYLDYVDVCNATCIPKFNISIADLQKISIKDEEQKIFLNNFYKFMPLMSNNSSMNFLCKYLEEIKTDINENFDKCTDFIKLYKNHNFSYTTDDYEKAVNSIKDIKKNYQMEKFLKFPKKEINNLFFKEYTEKSLRKIFDNIYVAVNCLIDYFYIQQPSSNKEILWSVFGKYIFNNVLENTKNEINLPLPDENGDVTYLNQKFSVQEVKIDDLLKN